MKTIEWEVPEKNVKEFWELNTNVEKSNLGSYMFWEYVRKLIPPTYGFDWKEPLNISGSILYPKIVQQINNEPNPNVQELDE